MRPPFCALPWLAALLLLASACGKARSNPRAGDANEVSGTERCYPLGHPALAQSLAEPLAVGRDLFGTVYALSRVGSTSLLWRSLDDRLIPYPVIAENRAGAAGASFGADDGNRGFALTLIPELAPTILRVFQRLSDAGPADSGQSGASGFTTGGTTLELLPATALRAFTVTSESSPALLVGSFRTAPDGAPAASLLLVRTELAADAPLALFYGEGNVLEQRELLELTPSAGALALRFELDGDEASAQISTDRALATGRLRVLGQERNLQRGVGTPLGLEKLELHCAGPVPPAWQRAEPTQPLGPPSCTEPAPLFACAVSTGPVLADTGTLLTAVGAAQVVELGSGLPADPNGSCGGRAAALAEDPRVTVRWAHFTHANGQLWLTVAGPDLELPLSVGQTVAVSSWDTPGFSWESWQGEVNVRSAADELLLWMGQDEDFFALNGTTAFDLIPGPERCISLLDCGGAVSRYALAARPTAGIGPDGLPPSGSAQLVGYGERGRLGNYYVYNGGIEAQTAAPLCFAKPSGNARLAVWKAPGD